MFEQVLEKERKRSRKDDGSGSEEEEEVRSSQATPRSERKRYACAGPCIVIIWISGNETRYRLRFWIS